MSESQTAAQRDAANKLFESQAKDFKTKFPAGSKAAELEQALVQNELALKAKDGLDDGWYDPQNKRLEVQKLKRLFLEMASECQFRTMEEWWRKMEDTLKSRHTSLQRLQVFQDFIWWSTVAGTRECSRPAPENIPIKHYETDAFRGALEELRADAEARPHAWIDEELRVKEVSFLINGLFTAAEELRIRNMGCWWDWYRPYNKTRDMALEYILAALTYMQEVSENGEIFSIWYPPLGEKAPYEKPETQKKREKERKWLGRFVHVNEYPPPAETEGDF